MLVNVSWLSWVLLLQYVGYIVGVDDYRFQHSRAVMECCCTLAMLLHITLPVMRCVAQHQQMLLTFISGWNLPTQKSCQLHWRGFFHAWAWCSITNRSVHIPLRRLLLTVFTSTIRAWMCLPAESSFDQMHFWQHQHLSAVKGMHHPLSPLQSLTKSLGCLYVSSLESFAKHSSQCSV